MAHMQECTAGITIRKIGGIPACSLPRLVSAVLSQPETWMGALLNAANLSATQLVDWLLSHHFVHHANRQ